DPPPEGGTPNGFAPSLLYSFPLFPAGRFSLLLYPIFLSVGGMHPFKSVSPVAFFGRVCAADPKKCTNIHFFECLPTFFHTSGWFNSMARNALLPY
ncbi:MAG: hypothetical protein ACKVX9_05740, partial [Blastocatellia bacterium]